MSAHSSGPLGVGGEAPDGADEGIGISDGDEVSALAIGNQVGESAGSRRDDRKARRHRLQHRVGRPLAAAGEHEDIGRAIGSGEILARQRKNSGK